LAGRFERAGVEQPTYGSATESTVNGNLHKVQMNGKAVFANAVRSLSESCQATLVANGLDGDGVDLVVAHQANVRIIEAVAHRTPLPMEKFHINIARYGNTSSASVPIALDEAVREGKVQDGTTILLCAFGAGFAWGSALIRW
jgi:3-oxoacyl-[acyl-carrier-protein] synthase-3